MSWKASYPVQGRVFIFLILAFLVGLWLNRPLPRPLARVEQASFLVYLYHSLLISALEWLSYRLQITDIGLLFCMRVPLIFIGTPILCIMWQELTGLLRSAIKNNRR